MTWSTLPHSKNAGISAYLEAFKVTQIVMERPFFGRIYFIPRKRALPKSNTSFEFQLQMSLGIMQGRALLSSFRHKNTLLRTSVVPILLASMVAWPPLPYIHAIGRILLAPRPHIATVRDVQK
jgi:hypothetical protein